jgi:CMP-2-keto-3-deoxyoctulosonic acid synthetase
MIYGQIGYSYVRKSRFPSKAPQNIRSFSQIEKYIEKISEDFFRTCLVACDKTKATGFQNRWWNSQDKTY